MRGRARAARFAAPVAFLVAATVAIMIVRSGLENGEAGPVTTTARTTTTAPAATRPATTAPATTAGEQFYVIEAGDTLAVIAEDHGTTVEQLLVLNPELDPVALTVGQRIRVK
jgi:LysM repeat protein